MSQFVLIQSVWHMHASLYIMTMEEFSAKLIHGTPTYTVHVIIIKFVSMFGNPCIVALFKVALFPNSYTSID